MYSTLKSIERFIDKIVDIIFIFVLIIGLYYVYDSVIVYKNSSTNSVMAYKPSKDSNVVLKELSEDCVAWISIYDTKVDYPVMQGIDNNEYLNKDPYGAYSLSGSIFLDYRNDKEFNDIYSLVYGHHMSGGFMFGALDDFEKKDFFDNHREGELIVNNKYYKIETFAFVHTDANEGIIFNPDFEADRVEWIKRNSEIYYEPSGSRIVALSTCKSPTSTLRTIVFVSIID